MGAVVVVRDDTVPLVFAVAETEMLGPDNVQLVTPEANHVSTDVLFCRTREGAAMSDMFLSTAVTVTLASVLV